MKTNPHSGSPAVTAPIQGNQFDIPRPENPLAKALDQPATSTHPAPRPANNVMRSQLITQHGQPPKNFGVVSNRVVRSAQPVEKDLPFLLNANVGILFNLQRAPEKLRDTRGIKCVHVPTDAHGCANDATTVNNLRALVDAILEAKEMGFLVLVHCTHGNDRTGALIHSYDRIIRCHPQQQATDAMRGNRLRIGGHRPMGIGRAQSDSHVKGVHNVWINIKGYFAAMDDEKIQSLRQQVAGLAPDEVTLFDALRNRGSSSDTLSLKQEHQLLANEASLRTLDHALNCSDTLRSVPESQADAMEISEQTIENIEQLAMSLNNELLIDALRDAGVPDDRIAGVADRLLRTAREANAVIAIKDKYERLANAAD